MKWSIEKPTEPGVYLWREIGKSIAFSNLCVIYDYEDDRYFGSLPTLSLRKSKNDSLLSELADRNWLRIEDN